MKDKNIYHEVTHKGFDIKFHYKQPKHKSIKADNPLEKKYNVKIRKHDLLLLDIVADKMGCTRSHLTNLLIESFLIKGLKDIKEHDVRALIAETADKLAGINYNSSWQETILSDYIQSTIAVMKKCNDKNFDNQYYYDDPHGYCQNSDSYSKVNEIISNKEETNNE